MEFTYSGYEKLINNIKDEGYVFSTYLDYDLSKKTVILRHDVDISVEQAYRMAQLEHKLGVVATYYFLIRSDIYNLFNKKNQLLVDQIREMGHHIGLHFDETIYDEDIDVPQVIKKEISIMETMLCVKVKSVSMHRPSKKTLEANYVIDNNNVINSYSNMFFNKFKYVSDSKHRWREDIDEIISSTNYPLIHLLTHPVWYHNSEIDMWNAFSGVLKEQLLKTYDDLLIYTTGVDGYLSVEECVNHVKNLPGENK